MRRNSILLVFLSLLLSTLACGIGGPVAWRNNEIRKAALTYELSARGPVDEVLVAYGLTEVRANLGFEAGNTVWLNPFAAGEYFRTRDADRTYLFLHDLEYTDGTASLIVDRGGPNGVQSYQLSLRQEDGDWKIVSDEPLEPPLSPTD
jgi:hypothetical protein